MSLIELEKQLSQLSFPKIKNITQTKISNNCIEVSYPIVAIVGNIARVYTTDKNLFDSDDEVIEYIANIKLDPTNNKKILFSTNDGKDYNNMFASLSVFG